MILDYQVYYYLDSYAISLKSFGSFRGSLFSKPVTGQELFAASYNKPTLIETALTRESLYIRKIESSACCKLRLPFYLQLSTNIQLLIFCQGLSEECTWYFSSSIIFKSKVDSLAALSSFVSKCGLLRYIDCNVWCGSLISPGASEPWWMGTSLSQSPWIWI